MDKVTKINRENFSWLFEQPIDVKVSLLQQHLSICQMVVNEILEQEVISYSGEKYNHEKPHNGRYARYGYNPSSVNIGGKRLKVDVPRVYDQENSTFKPLESFQELKKLDDSDERIMEGVLRGLSTRDYAGVIDHLQEGFGLSKSSVSQKFIKMTEESLKEFQSRDLAYHDFIAMFIDGKYMYGQQMIVALGVTKEGHKVVLGILQTSTENSVAIGQLLKEIKERGLKYQEGLLFIIDGAKGLKKAIQNEFGNKAVIQRCIWHKRENVMKYLAKNLHEWFKKEYHNALDKKSYKEAMESMKELIKQVKKANLQAANSLEEGLEEILMLHKLEANEDFYSSFSTTNCIESVNSQIKKYTGRVTNWSNSAQRYRWMAAAMLKIEPKLHKVKNYDNLEKLKEKIKNHIQNIEKESLNFN
jgi:transposase-like protein